MQLIAIEEFRKKVERQYIGFSPATTGVKPVHIANGLFRCIMEYTSDTTALFRFVISQSAKGEIPSGHSLTAVYDTLSGENRLDSKEVEIEELGRLRQLLKKVVAADSAVFAEKGMESYTAGSISFLSNDRIAQDGGEFVAAWLKRTNSSLHSCIKKSLEDSSDIISVLAMPLRSENTKPYIPSDQFVEGIGFASQPLSNPDIVDLYRGLEKAANTLSHHLENHSSKLFRLRIAVLFASFFLIRYMSSLAACYIAEEKETIPPFLLDFSKDSIEPVAKSSLMTYSRSCQAIARFYAWAFGEKLKELYTLDELKTISPPTYKNHQTSIEMKEVWDVAVQASSQSKQPYSEFGRAVYDMMAMEAEANPISYMRRLGLLSGYLYPPNQSAQRYVLKEDALEMLVRGAIDPGESVNMSTLQDRFWQRYRIIIGGRDEDDSSLQKLGIYQVDNKALRENRDNFANALSKLNFARLLADGVLQVKTEVANVSRT